jgi:hypothetical protein
VIDFPRCFHNIDVEFCVFCHGRHVRLNLTCRGCGKGHARLLLIPDGVDDTRHPFLCRKCTRRIDNPDVLFPTPLATAHAA